jgi:hypothetical protein
LTEIGGGGWSSYNNFNIPRDLCKAMREQSVTSTVGVGSTQFHAEADLPNEKLPTLDIEGLLWITVTEKWRCNSRRDIPAWCNVGWHHKGVYSRKSRSFINDLRNLYKNPQTNGSRVSSGSIVSDYGLDDRAIGVRSPAGAKDFSSSLCVQTGSVAHPASCTMGTGGPFPGAKRGRGVTLTTHSYLVPRS